MKTPPSIELDYGVNATAETLRMTLRQYIEAQYHIKNEDLISERRALLNNAAVINQRPYIEATASYEVGKPISELAIPNVVRATLQELVTLQVGLFEKPYVHQAEALEAFFRDQNDVVIATGTGSGKTESFLMPIIGELAVENAERPATASLPGIRALLLYPMNALVNDQLSRIRKLFGDEQASKVISRGRQRPVRFATYTGRTPYPGKRTAGKDNANIRPLFERYYLELMRKHPDVVDLLTRKGKWPSKDLEAFYAEFLATPGVYKTGKKKGQARTSYHWDERLLTAPSDRELIMRQEVQLACPDLLITNYSMLEYMLMRPIERQIFSATQSWLKADSRNQLLLIIDEAHMYYGATGTEVALLLRRFMSRLGVPREKVRCILTSASLGSSDGSAAADFARTLTGLREESSRKFTIISGTTEKRSAGAPGTVKQTELLCDLNISRLESLTTDFSSSLDEIRSLAAGLSWPTPPDTDEETVRDYLYSHLTGFGPAEALISQASGQAVALEALAAGLFPATDSEMQLRATSSLLALCTCARRKSDRKVLLPARLHLLFRGLPGLYACINEACELKLSGSNANSIVGRLYSEPRLTCGCSSKARVYEVLTHRDCGAAFLRGYINGPRGTFLWSEPGRPVIGSDAAAVAPIELLCDGAPHERHEGANCHAVWLDYASGRIFWDEPSDSAGFRKLWAPVALNERPGLGYTYNACPICLKNWQPDATKIMDHETKGEDPFAALVTAQLRGQPAATAASPRTPNAGRKVLLFSDGRQKAARLARDIPRAVEQDLFREALALSVHRLNLIGKEAKPNAQLYTSFLMALAEQNIVLFDGENRERLERDVRSVKNDYGTDLRTAILEFSDDAEPPREYNRHLLRQLCGRFYSISDVSVGFVEPAKREYERLAGDPLSKALSLDSEQFRSLAIAWLSSCLEDYAFNSRITTSVRVSAAGYRRTAWGVAGSFEKPIKRLLEKDLGEKNVKLLEKLFEDTFSVRVDGDGLYLEPRKLKVTIDLSATWFQCNQCTRLAAVAYSSSCIYCGAASLNLLDPASSQYISARKGFWRAPVERILDGTRNLENVSVEEHTAQLSHRDRTRVHATTEEFELRFQDILIDPDDRPIDILSCTTTMEVGIDIGALLAVGLRNVPPQRSNYQQRAGRAGRRGSAVSTVLTYAQHGPHDSFYFHNPVSIIAGEARKPELRVDNPKIARRHVNSFLFQTFFNEAIESGELKPNGDSSMLGKSLGSTHEFFLGVDEHSINLTTFAIWVTEHAGLESGRLRSVIKSWLPSTIRLDGQTLEEWISSTIVELLDKLEQLKSEVPKIPPSIKTATDDESANDDGKEVVQMSYKEELLEFLFAKNLLPTYAFPTDLAGFSIEEYDRDKAEEFLNVKIKELPQQSMDKALSEYAPGRLIVINKKTYRSGGVGASVLATTEDRAESLFERVKILTYCSACSYVRNSSDADASKVCPVCQNGLERHETIVPEMFFPENAESVSEDDRDQEITYATMAQFPVPVGPELEVFQELGANSKFTYAVDRQLITVNKGRSIQGSQSGFLVCEKCGAASVEDSPAAFHARPYLRPRRAGSSVGKCKGRIRNVYLGNIFSTDLLLLRFDLSKPIITNVGDNAERSVLQDALMTVSEALSIAAVRHRDLDLDPRDIGAGSRILPPLQGEQAVLDIYLYDTASGGAGYSELVAQHISEIVADAISLLEACPGGCERSCQECLRAYHNQHFQSRLDRNLGARFLRYAVNGEIPTRLSVDGQASQLEQLARYLSLEGFAAVLRANVGGETAPLLVSNSRGSVAIGTYPALLRESAVLPDPWEATAFRDKISVVRFDEYMLSRDVPDAQRRVSELLDTLGTTTKTHL